MDVNTQGDTTGETRNHRGQEDKIHRQRNTKRQQEIKHKPHHKKQKQGNKWKNWNQIGMKALNQNHDARVWLCHHPLTASHSSLSSVVTAEVPHSSLNWSLVKIHSNMQHSSSSSSVHRFPWKASKGPTLLSAPATAEKKLGERPDRSKGYYRNKSSLIIVTGEAMTQSSELVGFILTWISVSAPRGLFQGTVVSLIVPLVAITL